MQLQTCFDRVTNVLTIFFYHLNHRDSLTIIYQGWHCGIVHNWHPMMVVIRVSAVPFPIHFQLALLTAQE